MIKLRHYQKEVTPACMKYFRSHPDKNPLIALPTGAGKTYAIAELVKRISNAWGVKIIILSHVKEILEQNHRSLEKYLGKKVSLNSSMLGRREVGDITVAGIQSVYKNPDMFKDFDMVIVDEAHLINTKQTTMYQKFFNGIGKHTCVGFTGTPFRLGDGYIYGENPDTMFDDLIVDWTTKEKFNQLIDEGHLCKLTTKRTNLEMDTTGIRMKGGDFSEKQLADRFDKDAVTSEAIKEIIAAGKDRKKWLIFAIDINHAEHIAETLIRNGIPTAPVHSRMSEFGLDRAKVLKEFSDGVYRCVVNVNVLTTGFDEPGVDLIGVLRPTSSPVLHVQIAGRGSRIQHGKSNCLVLDFAGNTARLGAINDVQVIKKGKGKGGGEPITKTCPVCSEIVHASVRNCPECGYKFKFQHGLSAGASSALIINDGKPVWLDVESVTYEINSKVAAPSSVKVIYDCGGIKIPEWVCVEHRGFAKQKADHWVRFRGGDPCKTVNDFIDQADKISEPRKILVRKKNKYYLIHDSKF